MLPVPLFQIWGGWGGEQDEEEEDEENKYVPLQQLLKELATQ